MSDPIPIPIDGAGPVAAATGARHRFRREGPTVRVRLPIDPADAASFDDRFELVSTDGAYRQIKTVRDDQEPGDTFLDLVYTDLLPSRAYTLQIYPTPADDPYPIFEGVHYSQLPGMQAARAASGDEDDPPDPS